MPMGKPENKLVKLLGMSLSRRQFIKLVLGSAAALAIGSYGISRFLKKPKPLAAADAGQWR